VEKVRTWRTYEMEDGPGYRESSGAYGHGQRPLPARHDEAALHDGNQGWVVSVRPA
jgi:hypothetical protein